MELSNETQGSGVMVIRINGESLDASNVKIFSRDVQMLIKKNSRVVMDLSNIKSVESSGLNAFFFFLSQAKELEGRFILSGLSSQIRALFELMRMDKVFYIHETVDEAVATFE